MPSPTIFSSSVDTKWLQISRKVLNNEIPVTDAMQTALTGDKDRFSNLMVFLAVKAGIQGIGTQELLPHPQQSTMTK